MNAYAVRGRTAATAATANHAIATLWNPHSTKRVKVTEISIFKTAVGTAADALVLQRITARGTAGSTVTPDIDNSYEADVAPPSGPLLDLAAFTGQPTLATPPLKGFVAAAVAASGIVFPLPRELVIPPGTGLAIIQIAATIWPVSEIAFETVE